MKNSTKAALLVPVAYAVRPAFAAKRVVVRVKKNVQNTHKDMEYNLQNRQDHKAAEKALEAIK